MQDDINNSDRSDDIQSTQYNNTEQLRDIPKLELASSVNSTPINFDNLSKHQDIFVYYKYPVEYFDTFDKICEDKSIWDIVKWLISQSGTIIKLITVLITLQERIKMGDAKTTICGIVKGALLVLSVLGVNIEPKSSELIVSAALSIYAVVEVIQGWFAKDKEKKEEKK